LKNTAQNRRARVDPAFYLPQCRYLQHICIPPKLFQIVISVSYPNCKTFKSILRSAIVYSPYETYTSAEFYKAAMLVQSQNPEIFQVAERNIKNQKMIDNRGNAKIALP